MISLKMDVEQVEAIEAFSALKQSITHHLILEADRLHCPVTDQLVINHMWSDIKMW